MLVERQFRPKFEQSFSEKVVIKKMSRISDERQASRLLFITGIIGKIW